MSKVFFLFLMTVFFVGILESNAAEPITIDVDTESLIPGEIVEVSGSVDPDLADTPVAVEIRDSDGNTILIRTIQPSPDGTFSLKFKVPSTASSGAFDITANTEFEGAPVSESKTIESFEPEPESVCGPGTVLKDGVCVPKSETMEPEMKKPDDLSGGGCLIATATYGSELAPQVQQLRELRDNSLLQTQSGSAFMESFNQFYYSFSPSIADLERENLVFKEAVKLTITPLLTSLSILNYVDMDSEFEVLGYGISLIILNVGMYFVAPAIIIHRIKKYV